jgi:hypothetical protein
MYILDDLGYIQEFSSNHISCNNKNCFEYKGTIPSGYTSLEEWAVKANVRAYKIVNGNLSYDDVRDKELQNEYKFDLTNEIVITATNEPPKIDGEWELYDKEFEPKFIWKDDKTYISWGKISWVGMSIDYSGHNIHLNIRFINNAQITDSSNTLIGKLELKTLGIAPTNEKYVLPHAYFTTGFTDDGNCMTMITLSNDGSLTILDIIPDDYIISGREHYFSLTIPLSKNYMDDSKCNKFYWKRK